MGIIKDKKPYLVFKCGKCEQYMYVKPTQKTKKCLRCGKNYKVKKLNIVEEVEGMSAAVKKVKELQNALSNTPNLKGEKEFSLAAFNSNRENLEALLLEENDSKHLEFHNLLKELSRQHKKFPAYLIELMAPDYNIDKTEIKLLIHYFIKKGILTHLDQNYFTLS